VDVVVEYLLDLISRVGHWSYLLLFVAATLESAAFVGMVVPGDTFAILAGVLVSAGILELPQTLAVAAAGAAMGDTIGYELGRRLGRPWLVRHGPRFGIHAPRLERIERLFRDHGGKTVVIARFIGIVRAMTPFVAGSSRMPYGRFLLFNVIGGVMWALVYVLVGYFLAESWWIIERWVGRVGLILGLLVLTIVVLWLRQRGRDVSDPV
jgi:undecaprenyl-diphosphatase